MHVYSALYTWVLRWHACYSNGNMHVVCMSYRTRTKFRGINFRALAWSEFCGSIFSCGVIFVDTRCSRSEINFQLRSYTRNVKFIGISTKWGFLLLPLGYHVSWTHGRGTGNRAKPSNVAGTVQGSLLYAWKYNKPCMYQETFMQSANLFLATWRDHSCNMKLLVADNIFSWRVSWSPKRSDDTSILKSWSILTLNLITRWKQRCGKIGRKISWGGLIFVGKRYAMKTTKICTPRNLIRVGYML